MTMQTDVSVTSIDATGTVYAGRTRVRGMVIEPGASTGGVVFKDGGASGTTRFTLNTVANGETFNVFIPAEGVLFQTDVYVVLTNAKVTVFYG